MLYNIDEMLKEVNLTQEEKKKLIKEIKEEFPHDKMLFELHVYRAIQYLKGIKKTNK